MAIPLKPRVVDVVNLLIAKGANFALTALIFAFISPGMSAREFGEFGYWWSIAVMIGGIALGGVQSALVRAAFLYGTLRHLIRPLGGALIMAMVISALVWALSGSVLNGMGGVAIVGAVALFGVLVQTQMAILGLLRAAEATRENVLASLAIVAVVPVSAWFLIGAARGLPAIFLALVVSFAAGSLCALLVAWRPLMTLIRPKAVPRSAAGGFAVAAASFSAVSVFSYLAVNVDFTFYRLMASTEEFAVVGTGKVFFERIVLPALLVFAGAVSLRVMRHPGGAEAIASPRLRIVLLWRHVALLLALIAGLSLSYLWFARVYRGDAQTLPIPAVLAASTAYVLYAMNAMLFDVLVLRQKFMNVSILLVAFLVLHAGLQYWAVQGHGTAGWAAAWLLFNLVVTVVLARDSLEIHSSRGRSQSSA
jgi:hypothetical protein